jgi:hypothetical protein
VVDSCESDSEHLTRALTPAEEKDRQLCRNLIEDAFREFVGKTGTIILNIQFNEAPGDSIEAAVLTATGRRA